MKLEVIYQDHNLSIINKPAGLTVHKTNKQDNQITLVDIITKHWPEMKKHNWLDESRPGIVHRLDKDTSGIIVIAKNPNALKHLQEQFRSHKVKKTYKLLCFGKTPKTGEIKTLTTRDDKLYNKQKISLLNFSWQKGKTREAITTYKTIKYYQYKLLDPSKILRAGLLTLRSKNNHEILSLVEAEIKTGRTHQIRNHFKYINHPIIGDQMYNTKQSKKISDDLNIHSQFLHSSKIAFYLPNGKIKKEFIKLPKNLRDIIDLLKTEKGSDDID